MNQGMRVFIPVFVPVRFPGLGYGVVGAFGTVAKTIEDEEENRLGLHEKFYLNNGRVSSGIILIYARLLIYI